ncbi:MAG TPA: hypothetical protein VFU48_16305 [Nitrospira sp.]|nr:hypothetical protein [Nitrospira sp.]
MTQPDVFQNDYLTVVELEPSPAVRPGLPLELGGGLELQGELQYVLHAADAGK